MARARIASLNVEARRRLVRHAAKLLRCSIRSWLLRQELRRLRLIDEHEQVQRALKSFRSLCHRHDIISYYIILYHILLSYNIILSYIIIYYDHIISYMISYHILFSVNWMSLSHRERLKARRHSAVKIQSCWRGSRARQQVADVRRAHKKRIMLFRASARLQALRESLFESPSHSFHMIHDIISCDISYNLIYDISYIMYFRINPKSQSKCSWLWAPSKRLDLSEALRMGGASSKEEDASEASEEPLEELREQPEPMKVSVRSEKLRNLFRKEGFDSMLYEISYYMFSYLMNSFLTASFLFNNLPFLKGW